MIVDSAVGSRGVSRGRRRGRGWGPGVAAILVAAGCAGLASPAGAAELRIVMQTNTPAPIAGYRYTDLGYVALGEPGDIAWVSRARNEVEEKRVLFRENATSISPVGVQGTPRPGGGTWGPLDSAPLAFRGPWVFFATNDLVAGTSSVSVRGALEASTQPLISSTDAVGGKTVGPIKKFGANANRVVIAETSIAFWGYHPNTGITKLVAENEEIPGESVIFAQTFGGGFVDDADRYTCVVSGSGTGGSGNFVLHGVTGALRALPWFKSNTAASLVDVGRKGSLVAVAPIASTTETAVYVGAPEGALTEAFRFGAGVTVAGKPIVTIDQVRAISATSFAFIGKESNAVSHAMVFENGAVKELAGPGIDAPGTGQKFVSVRDIGVNSKGQVVFRGNFEKESTTGIFLYTPGQGVEYLAGRGSKIGAIDVGSVDAVDNGNIDEAGRVGFIAFHVSQNITALLATGKAGAPPPTDGADLELTAEQVGGEIVFHVKNLGPGDAKAGTLTIPGLALTTAPGLQLASCNVVNGDTVCDVFRGALTLKPGSVTDTRFLPPEEAGTRIEGQIVGASDPNLANNSASVTYEPKAAADSCGVARFGSGLRAERGAAFRFLAGLGLVAALGWRRRARRSRNVGV